MNIKQRFTSLLAALIIMSGIVLGSGCSSVAPESNAPMEREDSQTQKREQSSPSIKGEMEDVQQQKKSKGSDDMERLD